LADSDFQRTNLPWGWFGPYNKNEIAVVATNSQDNAGDPPMLWLASEGGLSLGCLTFGRARTDGSGKIDAMVLFQGKQDERTRDLTGPAALTGEFTIHIRKGDTVGGNDDVEFIKVFEARHDSVWWIGKDGEQVPPSEPPTGPPPPPAPPVEPPRPHDYRVEYKGLVYLVAEGSFEALEGIFKVKLDASDVKAWHDGDIDDWQEIIDKFFRKVAGDQ
jgi:hypothetical protein